MREGFDIAEGPAVSILATARSAARGILPPRYASDMWDRPFHAELDRVLEPNLRILDVGSGARPAVPPASRPAGCTYTGLDISADELAKAEPGSYDRTIVADVVEYQPELANSFDLVLSWFVLEHVKPIDAALQNMQRYLRPGGRLLAQLAGGLSPSGLANRAIPHSVAKLLLRVLLNEDPERVFPAHYDRCKQSALLHMLDRGWHDVEVRPLYVGAPYLRFSRLLTGVFVAYEEWTYRRDLRDLATYYLLLATKAGALEDTSRAAP
jgi:SAM-dependent methyltransferase